LMRVKTFSKIAIISVFLILVVESCSFAANLWIEPGSTITRLVFGMAYSPHTERPISLSDITVQTVFTDKRHVRSLMWGLEPANPREGYGPPVSSIVYGTVPRGYKSLGPTIPLEIGGHYVVSVVGEQGHVASIGFVVRSSGTVERE
jgi:hypothetical protein